MKKWMKICLMAAASAMLLAGCSTKDNAAGTTAVETTAKVEDTKETEKTDKTTQAAVSYTHLDVYKRQVWYNEPRGKNKTLTKIPPATAGSRAHKRGNLSLGCDKPEVYP